MKTILTTIFLAATLIGTASKKDIDVANQPLSKAFENTTKNIKALTNQYDNQQCRTKEYFGTKKIGDNESLEFVMIFCTKGFINSKSTSDEKFVRLKIQHKQTKNGVTKISQHESVHTVISTIEHPNMVSAKLIELSLSKIEKNEFSLSKIFDMNKLKLIYPTGYEDNFVRMLNLNGWGFVDLKDKNKNEDEDEGW